MVVVCCVLLRNPWVESMEHNSDAGGLRCTAGNGRNAVGKAVRGKHAWSGANCSLSGARPGDAGVGDS